MGVEEETCLCCYKQLCCNLEQHRVRFCANKTVLSNPHSVYFLLADSGVVLLLRFFYVRPWLLWQPNKRQYASCLVAIATLHFKIGNN